MAVFCAALEQVGSLCLLPAPRSGPILTPVFLPLHAPSSPPSSERRCLVLSPGLNHASEMEKAPRPGPVWLEEQGLSFECHIKGHNEGCVAGSRLEGRRGWRHGYGLRGCGPDGMLKPYGQTYVRKRLLFLRYDLRASCGPPHSEASGANSLSSSPEISNINEGSC